MSCLSRCGKKLPHLDCALRMELERVSPDRVVFVSYANPDQQRVKDTLSGLHVAGVQFWVDYEQLRAGMNWNLEIQRAISRADFIILCLSHSSVDRRGYLQREIKRALDRAQERLTDDVFVIPVLLDDDVRVPAEVASIQHVRLSKDGALQEIIASIETQTAKLTASDIAAQQVSEISWRTEK